MKRTRSEDLKEALPELERDLNRWVRGAWSTAVRIARKQRTRDGAQVAADPRREYSKRK